MMDEAFTRGFESELEKLSGARWAIAKNVYALGKKHPFISGFLIGNLAAKLRRGAIGLLKKGKDK